MQKSTSTNTTKSH